MMNSPVDLPYLPDDIMFNCLARVSRSYYPTLSLVSKRFRSLVSSHELYRIRALLGRTEKCVYVYLHLCLESTLRVFTLCRRPTPNPNPNRMSRWFTSCLRPQRILTNHTKTEEKKSSDNLMVSVPPNKLSPKIHWTRAVIGSNIYTIERLYNGTFSSMVFFMDCRSHTWHEAPSMQIARDCPFVNVLDGKIYVVKGCKNHDSSYSIEVFDPKTQIWEHLPSPSAEIRGSSIVRSFAINGKLYLIGDKSVVYKVKENQWDQVTETVDTYYRLFLYPGSSCVIDNVIYFYDEVTSVICWFDSVRSVVEPLKGLKKLPKLPKFASVAEYGGNIMVLWEKEEYRNLPLKKMVWCAEISLKRRNAQEIYGKIEWCDIVLSLSEPFIIVDVVTATV